MLTGIDTEARWIWLVIPKRSEHCRLAVSSYTIRVRFSGIAKHPVVGEVTHERTRITSGLMMEDLHTQVATYCVLRIAFPALFTRLRDRLSQYRDAFVGFGFGQRQGWGDSQAVAVEAAFCRPAGRSSLPIQDRRSGGGVQFFFGAGLHRSVADHRPCR